MAVDLLGAMRVEIVGDNSKLDKSIDNSKKNTEKFGQSTAKLGASLGKLFTGIGFAVVATKLFNLGKQAENLFRVQELAETKLDATLKATSFAAGLTADELKRMATELQDVTTIGDEATIGAQSLLLTFKEIGSDVFPRALESILDVSEGMGQDLKASSIQLGKALNDPVGGIAALTRVGIQFTDEQKDLIKSFVESGEVAKAQGVILDELESQFGGLARAAALTADGINKQLNNSFGDLLETIGSVISEGLTPYRANLKLEVESVNKSIQAHILRKKALEGNAELIELLTLRQIEQEKAEDRLAQALLNIDEAESQVLDTRHLSEIQIERIELAKEAAIETAEKLVISLESEVEAAKRATAATQQQVIEESNRVQANILLAQGIIVTTEETDENTESTEENTESKLEGIVATDNLALLNALLAEQYRQTSQSNDNFTEKTISNNNAIVLSTEEMLNTSSSLFGSFFSVLDSLRQSSLDAALTAIDDELTARLEAAGVAVETERERLQADLDNAIEAGDAEAELEASNALIRLGIQEDLDKEKRKLIHDAAVQAKIFGIIQAQISGLIGVGRALELPWPANLAAAIATGAASTANTIAIAAQTIPALAHGGIVAGNQFVGDKVPVMADSGEMFINRRDQANLMRFIQGGSRGTTNNNNSNTTINNNMFALGNRAQLDQAAKLLFDPLQREAQRRGAV